MKYKIEIAPLCNYYVIAAKNQETDELIDAFTLNESATDMLKLFCQGKNISAVAKNIAEMYEISEEQAFKDVSTFAEKLNRKGLL